MPHDAHVIRLRSLDDRLARQRDERARVVARASHAARTRDTRQKILIGAAVLSALAQDGVPALRDLDALRQWLHGRLTRPHDRAVFEMSPLQTPSSTPGSPR